MSILIRGMEMPKEEELLCLRIYPNGKVSIDMDIACKQIATAVLVPPHGRLIDADELFNDGWTLQKQVVRMGGYAVHEMPLNNLSIPTIIEAEPPKEDEEENRRIARQNYSDQLSGLGYNPDGTPKEE